MTIEEQIEGAVRRAVREEIRAALRDHRGAGGEEEPVKYAQAAAFAKLSKSTIALWVRRGLLASTGKGKTRRVLCSDVRKVLDSLRDAPKGEPVTAKTRALEIVEQTRARRRA